MKFDKKYVLVIKNLQNLLFQASKTPCGNLTLNKNYVISVVNIIILGIPVPPRWSGENI